MSRMIQKTMTQGEVLDRFEREYQRFHRLTENRVRECQSLLRQLGDHANKPVHEIEPNDFRSFFTFLNEQDFKITTIAKKLNLLKPFFRWAWEVGIVDADTYMRIQSVSPPRGSSIPQRPRPYSKKELAQFRVELDQRWPKASEMRWKRYHNGKTHFRKVQPEMMRVQIEAIVALALHCGLRHSEIFSASIDDVHYDNAYVVVRKGKGGKYREVPHTATSREAIKAWLEMRETLFRRAKKGRHDKLWLSLAYNRVRLHPMSEARFEELMRTIGNWELHRFRHTCGTEWLRAIKRLEVVQKLLGHAQISQTLTYAQLVNTDVLTEVGNHEDAFEEAVA
jgi:site-specific recombinase XerD